MFWPDVIALKEFYASPLGQVAAYAIRRHLRKFWPDVKSECILGLGFATPYLLPFAEEAQCVLACMPAAQGVIHWPPQRRNQSLLSDEAELPFADNTIHRVVVVHALENSEHVRQMMAEIWRVLTPGGRLALIVPNRRGIWARAPQSPFAYGQPFTAAQLRQLLSEHTFTPLHSESALFFPPVNRRYILRYARFWEGVGSYFYSRFAGVLMMEAEKRIFAPTMQKAPSRARAEYIPATAPQPAGMKV